MISVSKLCYYVTKAKYNLNNEICFRATISWCFQKFASGDPDLQVKTNHGHKLSLANKELCEAMETHSETVMCWK